MTKTVDMYGFLNYEQMLNLRGGMLDKRLKQAYDKATLALKQNEC